MMATGPGRELEAPPADGAARDDALDVLNFAWGGAYEIGGNHGWYWARRRDGLGGIIGPMDAEGLNRAIAEDFAFRAVR